MRLAGGGTGERLPRYATSGGRDKGKTVPLLYQILIAFKRVG